MAGNPKARADLARLEDPALGEEIMGMLEAGVSIARICERTGLGKRALAAWLEAPERAEMASRARARAADHLVHEALEIVDNVGAPDPETGALVVSSEAIQHAKLRATTRQWVAERWGRDIYGAPKTQVTVSIGALHLEALKAPRNAELPMVEVVEAQPVEAEREETLDDL